MRAPVGSIRSAADGGRHRKRGVAAALIVVVGLVAAACGGGGSKKTAAGAETTTSSAVTSTTGAVTQDTSAAVTTSSTAGSATSTTAKKTATAAKKTTATSLKVGTKSTIAGGITNVTAAPTTVARDDIQPGGTITMFIAGDIQNLDPITMQNSGSTDAIRGSAVYDMLLYSDLKTSTITPQTAESLTSADALVWTLKLHPNIKFSDGTPYDAAAVRFNWLRLQDPKNAAARATQANTIAQMDVVDAVTLKITLKSKNAVFPGVAALIPFIASPKAIQDKGSNYGNDPVGAGPFLLKQ